MEATHPIAAPKVVANAEILPLTGLRFLAALFVFMFHIQIRWPLPIGTFAQRVLSHGAAGMSLFFILSGYVLAYRYYRSGINLKEYAWNRIGRIYPVYALAALLALPFLYASLRHADHPWTKLAALVAADTSVTQAWFPPMFNYWNNGGSWSISVEAFFYLLFPALTVALRRLRSLWLPIGIAYAAAALPGLAYMAFRQEVPNGLQIFYAMPIFRFGEFAMGALLYALSQERRVPHATALFLIPAIVLAVYFGLSADSGIFVSDNWIVVPAIGSIVLATGVGTGWPMRLLGSRPMVWLGKISYCFYSFQVVLVLALMSYSSKFGPPIANHLLLMLASLGVLIVLSGAGYHFVEEPMRKRIRAKAHGVRRPEPIPIV